MSEEVEKGGYALRSREVGGGPCAEGNRRDGLRGDPHLPNERKADEVAKQITEDTGAEGDMIRHAERKVDQMGSEMFQD